MSLNISDIALYAAIVIVNLYFSVTISFCIVTLYLKMELIARKSHIVRYYVSFWDIKSQYKKKFKWQDVKLHCKILKLIVLNILHLYLTITNFFLILFIFYKKWLKCAFIFHNVTIIVFALQLYITMWLFYLVVSTLFIVNVKVSHNA